MARAWAELHVLSGDESVGVRRRQAAESVLSYFEEHYAILSDPRVVCILDACEGLELKQELGSENRGLHSPPRGHLYRALPNYVQPLIGPVNPTTNKVEWPFDMFIYLHGSTCETEVGLTLSLAHELQHFMQYAQRRSLWALNLLLVELRPPEFKFWWDFPTEREARVVSKRVGVQFFGEDAVNAHIQTQILAHITDTDVRDWEFVLGLDLSIPYYLDLETMRLVEKHRTGLVRTLKKFRGEKTFVGLDLEKLIQGEPLH